MRDVTDEHHLEAGQAVVAQGAAHEDLVLLLQALDRDVVVEHDGPGFAVKGRGKARSLRNEIIGDSFPKALKRPDYGGMVGEK